MPLYFLTLLFYPLFTFLYALPLLYPFSSFKPLCCGQIPIFIKIVTHVSLHQNRPERNGKPEYLPEITSAMTEEKPQEPPRDYFSPSHSSRWELWRKHFVGRESRSPQRRPTMKSSTFISEQSSAARFCDL